MFTTHFLGITIPPLLVKIYCHTLINKDEFQQSSR